MEAGRPLFIPVILGTARMGRMSLTQLSLSPGNWASAQALRPTSSKSRGISLTPLTRSVEFRRELRLEAAACLFELGFSPCHVSQQCVQLLWTQNQQSEHKHEQDFGTQTHDSPLGQALVVGNGGCCAGRLLFIFNSYLEAADALSNSFAKFRKLFGPEHEQGNSENNQQMHGLKQSFKHIGSLNMEDSFLSRLALQFLFGDHFAGLSSYCVKLRQVRNIPQTQEMFFCQSSPI